jgi:hypothetical protein
MLEATSQRLHDEFKTLAMKKRAMRCDLKLSALLEPSTASWDYLPGLAKPTLFGAYRRVFPIIAGRSFNGTLRYPSI